MWFVAHDVTQLPGIGLAGSVTRNLDTSERITMCLRHSDDSERSFNQVKTLGSNFRVRIVSRSEGFGFSLFANAKAPKMRLISESGLYKLVMRSDKPEAKSFQDWVTKVVLPAIRQDGGRYSRRSQQNTPLIGGCGGGPW